MYYLDRKGSLPNSFRRYTAMGRRYSSRACIRDTACIGHKIHLSIQAGTCELQIRY